MITRPTSPPALQGLLLPGHKQALCPGELLPSTSSSKEPTAPLTDTCIWPKQSSRQVAVSFSRAVDPCLNAAEHKRCNGQCEHAAGVWGILLDGTGSSGQHLPLVLLGRLGKCSRLSAAQVWLPL